MKYTRKSQQLIPRKVFIFTEGSVTEQQYFQAFVDHFRIPQARVQVIDRKTSRSSPKAVIDYVIDFQVKIRKQEADIAANYAYWLVMDTDRWGANLAQAVNEAYQRKYDVAVSNPCFEIWLLLHHKDAIYVLENKHRLAGKSEINLALHEQSISGKYQTDFFPQTCFAIQNAKKLDTKPTERLPSQFGTRIYRLIESLWQYM